MYIRKSSLICNSLFLGIMGINFILIDSWWLVASIGFALMAWISEFINPEKK